MDETFDFEKFDNLKLEFQEISNELLSAFSKFINENLVSSEIIEEKKMKLLEKKSIKCLNLEDLIFQMKETIEKDFIKVDKQKKSQKLDFIYFLTLNNHDEKTLTVYNRLEPKIIDVGFLIYPVVSIRKHEEIYYHWKH